jgi:hypothetical protein
MSSDVTRLQHPLGPSHNGRSSWLTTNWLKCTTSLFLACVLLCSAQLQLAQPAHAVSSEPTPRTGGTVSAYAAFLTRGTNGFRISVTGSPKGVRLVASRRHEAAVYLDREGVANQSGIHANFGRVGEIDLRFHALRKAHRTLGQPADWTGCELDLKDRYGYFTGTVVFRGEEGFTKLRQRKVYGRAAPAQRLKCIGRSSRSMRELSLRPSVKRPELSTGLLIPVGLSFIALRSFHRGR